MTDRLIKQLKSIPTNNSRLVVLLTSPDDPFELSVGAVCDEAADEIEKLQEERKALSLANATAFSEIKKLREALRY